MFFLYENPYSLQAICNCLQKSIDTANWVANAESTTKLVAYYQITQLNIDPPSKKYIELYSNFWNISI